MAGAPRACAAANSRRRQPRNSSVDGTAIFHGAVPNRSSQRPGRPSRLLRLSALAPLFPMRSRRSVAACPTLTPPPSTRPSPPRSSKRSPMRADSRAVGKESPSATLGAACQRHPAVMWAAVAKAEIGTTFVALALQSPPEQASRAARPLPPRGGAFSCAAPTWAPPPFPAEPVRTRETLPRPQYRRCLQASPAPDRRRTTLCPSAPRPR